MFVRASIAPSSGANDVAVAWKTGGYVSFSVVAHQTLMANHIDTCAHLI